MGRPWTMRDERYIHDHIGIMNAEEMAYRLGRSYGALRAHCTLMRKEGRLDAGLATIKDKDEFVTLLGKCCECYQWRATCDSEGVCRVCRDTKRLEHHRELLQHAYACLPQEIKDTTNGTFEIKRAPELMSKSKGLRRPKKPNTSDMSPFERDLALDKWYRATEQYELSMLRLDIDATKQRRSKWIRKTKKWKENRNKN